MSEIQFTYALDFVSRRRHTDPRPAPEAGETVLVPIPRIARLLALAIRLQELVRKQKIRDYAEAAHLGRVTRARMATPESGLFIGVLDCDVLPAPVVFCLWVLLEDIHSRPLRSQSPFSLRVVDRYRRFRRVVHRTSDTHARETTRPGPSQRPGGRAGSSPYSNSLADALASTLLLQREIRTRIIGVSHWIPQLLATFRSGTQLEKTVRIPTVPSEWLTYLKHIT